MRTKRRPRRTRERHWVWPASLLVGLAIATEADPRRFLGERIISLSRAAADGHAATLHGFLEAIPPVPCCRRRRHRRRNRRERRAWVLDKLAVLASKQAREAFRTAFLKAASGVMDWELGERL